VVPTDGTLLYATAMLDESSLSGEADWVTRKKGETVYAGTFNRGAAFCMRAERLPEQSRAAEIQSLSARISLDKAPVARLADRLATVFVPTVLFLAAATYGLHRLGWLGSDPDSALSAALAVLIVSCPCALALAIPAATAAALIRARRLGVLLADSSLLELLPKVRQVLLDKTGTLLAPDPVLTDVVVCSRYRADSCYRLAVALQRHSNHPIAHAFRALALDTAVTVRSGETAFEELPTAVQSVSSHAGLGLVGEIETGSGAVVETRLGSAAHCSVKFADRPQTVYLSVNDELVACFTLSDQLRDDAKRATQRLRQDGCSLAVLSGDSEAACRQLSAALDLEAIGELTPEAKQQQLKSRRDAADGSGAVMFVGDGINDSLAFAEADIAVATLETTDFVQANADAVLLSRRLECVPDLFALAHRVRRVMHQNLAWALGYNLIAIPLAMAGWVPPWLAAVGMACSSLIVLGNATRLLRFEPSATGSVT
ncbi:MAG: heavy metal translocating P-type ATPase, partial [Pseudomonadota bacterium]